MLLTPIRIPTAHKSYSFYRRSAPERLERMFGGKWILRIFAGPQQMR